MELASTVVERGSWMCRLGWPAMGAASAFGAIQTWPTLLDQFGAAVAVLVGAWTILVLVFVCRMARLAVIGDAVGLTIRNPLRTRCLPWETVRDIRFERRRSFGWLSPVSFWGIERHIGVVELEGGAVVEMFATESVRQPAYFGQWVMSWKPQVAAEKVHRLRTYWETSAGWQQPT